MRFLRLRCDLIAALIFAVGLLPFPVFAGGGVSFVAHVDHHHGGPGPNFGFYYASCWGYVAQDGHEYALIGCYSGTSIIDLDANPIDEVAYIPGSNSEWKELKVWGDYAYAVSENTGQGLQIINLSQLPDTAWLVRAVYNVGGHNIANSHTVTVADGYLYLNGGASNGTVILSLADPENPVYVGQYQPEYLHDTYVKRDTLYGAAIYGGGVYIANVSNKGAPVQVAHITYSGSGTHNTWKSDFGSYLFTTDEIGTTQKNMKVWDISHLPTFTQLPSFTADPTSIIHNVHGRGNYVYIAHYNDGVFVADIHDPMNIVNAGQYDTYLGGQTGYIGCWGAYPYFPSGRWIASDTQTGLYVLSFSGLAPRIRSPLLEPANGAMIADNVSIDFRWRHAASQAEDPHHYQFHVWGPNVDTLLTTTDSTVTVGAIFTGGQTYSWSVLIQDEFTAVASQDTFQFSIEGSAIPCSDITSMAARCIGGGTKTIQVRVNLLNSIIHAGQTVTITIDEDTYTETIITNGTHSRANFSVPGYSVGDHVVSLVNPPGCLPDAHPTCVAGEGVAKADPVWDDDAEWSVENVPEATKLVGNYPNPLNPSTTILYALGQDTYVKLAVYNMLGQLVTTLVEDHQTAGHKSVVWNGRNEAGESVASGIYIYKLSAGSFTETRRMLLLK